MYSAYTLTEESREELLKAQSPLFGKIICHHITYQFPVKSKDDLPPTPKKVRVIGYSASRTIGVECWVVEIDGEIHRPDHSLFHITISVDEHKKARPAQSNELLRKNKFKFTKLYAPIEIEVVPEVLG